MTREDKIKAIKAYCESKGCEDCMLMCRNGETIFKLANPDDGSCAVRPFALERDAPTDEILDEALLNIIGTPAKNKKDMINPDHYKVHANECIDEIQAMLTPEEFKGFLKGNFLKYRYRTGHKDDPEQEAQKSDWYMNKLMEVEKNGKDL